MPTPREVIWTVVDDETLFIDVETGDYFALNAIGSHMWDRLRLGETPSAIVADVAAHYAMDRDTVEGDLAELMMQLRNARLLGDE